MDEFGDRERIVQFADIDIGWVDAYLLVGPLCGPS